MIYDPEVGSSVNGQRVVWRIVHGAIPTGLQVCHSCDNPPCCNPAHLFLGTHHDNHEDKRRKGRASNQWKQRTHCVHGHPLSGENVYHAASGQRVCKTCRRRCQKEWLTRHPEQAKAKWRRKYLNKLARHALTSRCHVTSPAPRR